MEIKQNPEDFIVEEIIDLDKRPGDYLYVKLTKKNWNTLDVIDQISKILNIPKKFIGFAGTKDKRAITTQYISLYKVKKEDLIKISLQDVRLIPLHSAIKPITLGSLSGNYFKIKNYLKLRRLRFDSMANYYGEQRFSSNNKEIGKALLLKHFKEACRLINNDKINNYLKNSNNHLNALKLLDRNLLSLYLNAYQAYLWNEVAKQYIRENCKKKMNHDDLVFVERPRTNATIPLISYDTKFKNHEIKRIYQNLLRREGIRLEDYKDNILGIISKTGFRPLFIKVNNFKISRDFIEFFLPKGSYATIAIKNLEALAKL